MTASTTEVQRLANALASDLAPLDKNVSVSVRGPHPSLDWAASGAMHLTGAADGPPQPAPGAPASAFRAALAFIPGEVPGVELLGERAALAGLGRNAPRSPGGAFQALRARNGWLGVSLARDSDLELIGALTEREGTGSWDTLAAWVATQDIDAAAARAHLLGLAAAVIDAPTSPRGPVEVSLGGARRTGHRPLVLDLTSLWAGPLCAHLLGLGGARVIKVESVHRLDGARQGPSAFFDLLHGGHESVVLDLSTQGSKLARLVDRADVVLEASRPRALRQLGIDAHTAVADGTIWASITAYGRREPMRVGFGDDVAAGAGLFVWCDGRPVPVGDAIADPLAGAFTAAAVSVALRGDRGCLLDVSMHAVAVAAATAQVEQRTDVTVARPRARTALEAARPAGADTEAVLAELG